MSRYQTTKKTFMGYGLLVKDSNRVRLSNNGPYKRYPKHYENDPYYDIVEIHYKLIYDNRK